MVHKEENPWKVQVTLSQGLLGYHSRNLHLLVTMQAVILPSSVRSCLTGGASVRSSPSQSLATQNDG